MTDRPAFLASIAVSTGTALRPPALKMSIASVSRRAKLASMASASPGIRSMNMAWRCPLAPAISVWNVIDSSTMGCQPG